MQFNVGKDLRDTLRERLSWERIARAGGIEAQCRCSAGHRLEIDYPESLSGRWHDKEVGHSVGGLEGVEFHGAEEEDRVRVSARERESCRYSGKE